MQADPLSKQETAFNACKVDSVRRCVCSKVMTFPGAECCHRCQQVTKVDKSIC